jgi:hypothetical protein
LLFCSSRNETFRSLWVDSPVNSIKLASVSGRIRLCWEAT